MKKLSIYLVSLLALFVLCGAAQSAVYLYANASNSTGGIRFDIADQTIVDLSTSIISNSAGSKNIYYADIFKGNWGLGVQATFISGLDPVYDFSLLFATEQPLNNNITLAVGVPVITVNTASPTTTSICPSFFLYSVIKI